MNCKNQVKNSVGTSLVELMMVLGIMGIIITAMATLFNSQQKQIRSLAQHQDAI